MKKSVPRAIVPFTVVLAVTVLIPRLLIFPVLNLGPDEVAYGLIGREMLHGHWPYTTAFDHKPVALYYPFALSQAIFGSSMTSLRFVALVGAVISFALAYLVCNRLGVRAWGAALLSGVYALMCLGNDGLAALSEPILNVYVLGILLLLTYRLTFASGVAIGVLMALAINTNYLVGPVLVVPGLFFLWRGRKAKMAWAGGVVGFLAGCLGILLPVVVYSDITSYFQLQQTFLSVYEAAPLTGPQFLADVERFLAPTLAILIAPIATLMVHGDRGRGRRVVALAWPMTFLAVSVITACYNRFFYPHYTIIVAPAALVISALAVNRLKEGGVRVSLASLVAVVAAWVMVVPILPKLVLGTDVIRAQMSLEPDETAPEMKVADAVERVIAPGDAIYTLDVHDYLLTGARLPTKFFFPDQNLKPANAAALGSTPSAQMQQILEQRPKAIVMRKLKRSPSSVAPLVDAYVRDRCRLSSKVAGAVIYACSTS